MQSHIRNVYACLAVTCHLYFGQNDRDLLRATAVTRGWNGYRNKSQHRKSTLEKKILPPFQQGFEPATFHSRVRRSNHWTIPDPKTWGYWGQPNRRELRQSRRERAKAQTRILGHLWTRWQKELMRRSISWTGWNKVVLYRDGPGAGWGDGAGVKITESSCRFIGTCPWNKSTGPKTSPTVTLGRRAFAQLV